MSELNFKRYSDLDVGESLTNTSHVIIEDDGEVKRFPASKLVGGSGSSQSNSIRTVILKVLSEMDENDETVITYSIDGWNLQELREAMWDGPIIPFIYNVDITPDYEDYRMRPCEIEFDGNSFIVFKYTDHYGTHYYNVSDEEDSEEFYIEHTVNGTCIPMVGNLTAFDGMNTIAEEGATLRVVNGSWSVVTE